MNTKVSTVMLIALYWFETKGCMKFAKTNTSWKI